MIHLWFKNHASGVNGEALPLLKTRQTLQPHYRHSQTEPLPDSQQKGGWI